MKTIAELDAAIASHFKQAEAPQDLPINPAIRVYGYEARLDTPNLDEALIDELWSKTFEPLMSRNFTIFWRRRPGFQGVTGGKRISMRAAFVQDAP